MSLKRMRTIPEVLNEIRSLDPKSAITPYCIRMLCKNKLIRCIYTGRKIIVDLDDLLSYLNGDLYDNCLESVADIQETATKA